LSLWDLNILVGYYKMLKIFNRNKVSDFKVRKPQGLQALPPRRFASSPPIRYEESLACACGTGSSVEVIKLAKFTTETRFADGKVCEPSLLASSPEPASSLAPAEPERHVEMNEVCKPQGWQALPLRLLARAGRDCSTDKAEGPERHFGSKLLKMHPRNRVCKSQGWQAWPPRLLASSPEPAEIIRRMCPRVLNVILF